MTQRQESSSFAYSGDSLIYLCQCSELKLERNALHSKISYRISYIACSVFINSITHAREITPPFIQLTK